VSLQPLQQWICDTCGDLIQCPEDGWLEWIATSKVKPHGFRVVHNAKSSPYSHTYEGCRHYEGVRGRKDMPFGRFVGPDGLGYITELLDWPDSMDTPDRVDNGTPGQHRHNIAELIRRLHIPHYEEARACWTVAEQDGYFRDGGGPWMYEQRTLKEIIDRYGS